MRHVGPIELCFPGFRFHGARLCGYWRFSSTCYALAAVRDKVALASASRWSMLRSLFLLFCTTPFCPSFNALPVLTVSQGWCGLGLLYPQFRARRLLSCPYISYRRGAPAHPTEVCGSLTTVKFKAPPGDPAFLKNHPLKAAPIVVPSIVCSETTLTRPHVVLSTWLAWLETTLCNRCPLELVESRLLLWLCIARLFALMHGQAGCYGFVDCCCRTLGRLLDEGTVCQKIISTLLHPPGPRHSSNGTTEGSNG